MTELLIASTTLIFGMVCIGFLAQGSLPFFFGFIVWIAYTLFLALLVIISGMGSNSGGMEYIVFIIYITSGIFLIYYLSKQTTEINNNNFINEEVGNEHIVEINDINNDLIAAIANNDIKAVINCLALGVNPNKINNTGYTAIDYARGHGYGDIQNLLELNIRNRSSSIEKDATFDKKA